MTEYTPTTEQVREGYVEGMNWTSGNTDAESVAEFDGWLAGTIAEAKAEALREAADVIERLDSDAEMYDEDLKATPVDVWLRTRAEQYKEEN